MLQMYQTPSDLHKKGVTCKTVLIAAFYSYNQRNKIGDLADRYLAD